MRSFNAKKMVRGSVPADDNEYIYIVKNNLDGTVVYQISVILYEI